MLKIVAGADRLDPNNPAVAAILSLDVDVYTHGQLAEILAPHLAAAPAIREWSVDDEWTAAEEILGVAAGFVDSVRNPVGHDPWPASYTLVDRIRKLQRAHRESVVLDRVGAFPGYKIRVDDQWPHGVRVRIHEAAFSTDLVGPIIVLNTEPTRREVELSIAAWKAGHERGLREGARQIRDGIKSLLELEDA